MSKETTRVLFVCLGNICRSPTAEGVFRALVRDAGLERAVIIDSAGTGGWHAGESPDPRMIEAARRRGYELTGRARQVQTDDFRTFDLILAMDQSNYDTLRGRSPSDATAELRKFRDFDPEAPGADVPDPYYGGERGFDDVVDMVERTARELLRHVRGRA